MYKRIIIEGADQQGKSTLCQMLAMRLGWKVIHFNMPNSKFDFFNGYFVGENTICDRSFLSEIVYSKIRGAIPRVQSFHICNRLSKENTLIILMDREDSFVFDNYRKEEYSEEAIKKAIDLYKSEFTKLPMEKLHLNPNSDDYTTRVENLIKLIKDGNI